MRKYWCIPLFLLALALPAWSADTLESLAKRVRELEKANTVLQEDLTAAQADIATLRTELRKVRDALSTEVTARQATDAKLTAEITAREELEAKVTALQQALDKEIAARTAEDAKLAQADIALAARITALEQALAAHDADNAQKFAALREALDNERAERLANQELTNKLLKKLADRAKKDRNITYLMGLLLGGAIAAQ